MYYLCIKTIVQVISERNSKNQNSDKRTKHTIGNLSFPESEDTLVRQTYFIMSIECRLKKYQ